MEKVKTNEWTKYELSDICKDVRYGYTASSNHDQVGPKFLRITDIVPDFIDWNDVPYCEISEKDIGKYKLEKGDIVVARTGATTGYAKRIKNPPNAVFASYLVRLKIKEEFNDEYVGYVIESNGYKEFIKKNWSGAAQPNANAQVITSYSLKIPDESSQKRIASILSAFDDLIENNSRRIEILEEMARRIYREWFVHFRYPGHDPSTSSGQRLVDSGTDLGEIPEGWEVRNLKGFLKFKNGKSPETKEGEEYPVYGSNGIIGKCNEPGWEDGIIIGRVGAYCGSVEYCEGKFWGSDNTIVATTREEYDFSLFAYYKLEDLNLRRYAGGSAQPLMTQTVIKDIKIAIPRNGLLVQFSEQARELWKFKRNLEKKNKRLKETRDLLLPKLISGKIDVGKITVN